MKRLTFSFCLCLAVLGLASCTFYEDHYLYPSPNQCQSDSTLVGNGASCDADTQCCSGSCGDEGTCCVQPGDSCRDRYSDSACCVGKCGNAGACICSSVGKSCSRFSDCCSGDCNNGRCVASNGSCATTADCTSGTCEHFRCTAPSDIGVSVDGLSSVDLATQD